MADTPFHIQGDQVSAQSSYKCHIDNYQLSEQQWLLTFQVSSYCCLPLHGSDHRLYVDLIPCHTCSGKSDRMIGLPCTGLHAGAHHACRPPTFSLLPSRRAVETRSRSRLISCRASPPRTLRHSPGKMIARTMTLASLLLQPRVPLSPTSPATHLLIHRMSYIHVPSFAVFNPSRSIVAFVNYINCILWMNFSYDKTV